MKMFMAIPAYIWLIGSALFFAGGEYLSKKWGMHPSTLSGAVVVLIDAVSTFLWLPALLHKNQLAITGTAWLLLAMIATLAIGLMVFREHLNPYQVTGVFLAGIALILLNIS